MKHCNKCGDPLTAGVNWRACEVRQQSNICRSCARVRDRGYERPTAILLRAARHRALESGTRFDLRESDIVIPKHCPVLGIPISVGGGHSANSPSIDRFDPKAGYIASNINIISWRANRLKSDANPEELERIAAWMRSGGWPGI